MTDLVPTTELDAINQMLDGIGESPVSTVVNSGNVDVVNAVRTLRTISRAVQLEGWHFNTEENYSLPLSYPDHFIMIPSNCLRVDTTGDDFDVDITQRGTRLYDKTNHTYVFERPLKVDMILLLAFEELPEAARNYITVRAIRYFQQNQLGSPVLQQYQERDEMLARVLLEEAEAQNSDSNMLTDNITSFEIINRKI